MPHRLCPRLLTCLAALAALTGAAHAQVTVYTDRATFQANAPGLTDIDFEDIAPVDGFINFGTGASLTLLDVTFTALDADLFVNDANAYLVLFGTPFNLGAGDFLQAGNGNPSGLEITFDSAVDAVGFDFSTFDDRTSQVAISLSTGDSFTLSAPDPEVRFFGFTSGVPVTSMTVRILGGNRRDTLNLDSFQFRRSAAAPEPSALALHGVGLLALLSAGRLASRRRVSDIR